MKHAINLFILQSNEACTMESPIRYSAEYHQAQTVSGEPPTHAKRRRDDEEDQMDTSDDDADSANGDFDDPPLPWDEDWLRLSDDERAADSNSFPRRDSAKNKRINVQEARRKSLSPSSEEDSATTDSSAAAGRILCPRDKLLVFTTGTLTYTPHQARD